MREIVESAWWLISPAVTVLVWVRALGWGWRNG